MGPARDSARWQDANAPGEDDIGKLETAVHGCVVCNGEILDYAWTRTRVAACDLVVAADGGAAHLRAMGIEPQVIVGDMDSCDLDEWPPKPGTEHVQFPREKDATDGELAVDLAFARGCETVGLLGATGGRIDHFLGNVGLLTRYPGRLFVETSEATLVAVDRNTTYDVRGTPGSIVSIIPFPAAEGVRTAGLQYALSDEDLRPGTRGISNVLTAPEARIQIRGGMLMVYTQRESPLND